MSEKTDREEANGGPAEGGPGASESGEEGGYRTPWADTLSDVGELVSDVLEGVRGLPGVVGRFPRLDVYRTPDAGYRVLVDLPGVERGDVTVTTAGDELRLEGRRRRLELPEGAEVRRSERPHGRFRRSFRIPADADPEGVTAKLEGGVLEILLPLEEPSEERRVEIV